MLARGFAMDVLQSDKAPGADDEAKAQWAARLALYGSHGLSAWGQRSWEFAVGLLMLQLRPESLLLVSVFGLADSGAQVLAGASIGDHLGRTSRLHGAWQMYALQNAGVAVSASAVFPLLTAHTAVHSGALFWALTTATIAAGSLGSVGAMGSTLAVEREWTKALCYGNSAALASMNAGMRRIDLSCLILAPIGVGFLMTYSGSRAAVLAICAWNLLVWAPEALLLSYSIRQVPRLSDSKLDCVVATQQQNPSSSGDTPAARQNPLGRALAGWRIYTQQPVLPAAFALALLYLTVMSLGLLMTAYLKAYGMTEAVLSLFRGAGAAAGVAATLTFPMLHGRLGLVGTGQLGIWLQAASLWVGVAPSLAVKLGAALPAALVSHVLVSGVALSRFGLWTFDLAVSQMLQERVADGQLNVVSGVQGSLQSLFGMSSYVAALAFPGISTFTWLMVTSCSVVASAGLIFTAGQSETLLPQTEPPGKQDAADPEESDTARLLHGGAAAAS